MITVKKILNLELSEDDGGRDQPENPCTITIIRVGDLAGSSAQELRGSDLKPEDKHHVIPLPDLYDLEPFARPEEPLDLEIELYQMEPSIEN